METWRDIKGFEGLYQVSNEGRVRNIKTNKLLSTKKGHPYVQVCLTKDKVHKYILLHRLVWETFNGTIPDNYEVNHKDECHTNNSLNNLEIMTHSQNINYGSRNERVRKKMIGVKPSSKAVEKSKKLFSQSVDQISIITGEVIQTFYSMMEAERKTGTRSGNISKCCNGQAKTANGYIWRKPL